MSKISTEKIQTSFFEISERKKFIFSTLHRVLVLEYSSVENKKLTLTEKYFVKSLPIVTFSVKSLISRNYFRINGDLREHSCAIKCDLAQFSVKSTYLVQTLI